MTDKKLRAVGIHVFAGLFTAGVKAAGFDVVAMLEEGKFGQATHKLNFDTPIYDAPASWPLQELRGVDLVYSNSPCAGLSIANSQRGADNPTNNALDASNEAAMKLLPKVYLVESVGALFSDGLPLVERWEAKWHALGYNTCRLTESAELLGLPQIRRRAVFVAAKADIDFAHPDLRQLVTVRDAIADLADYPLEYGAQPYVNKPVSAYVHRAKRSSEALTHHAPGGLSKAITSVIPHLAQGQRIDALSEAVLDQTYRPNRVNPQKPGGRPSLLFRRLAWDKPSVVLTGGGHWFHPDQHRLLTVREQARLMGVPDWFRFASTPSNAYVELGKAVSPVVAEWLACHARTFVESPTARAHKHAVSAFA